jgi:hypothetical protein
MTTPRGTGAGDGLAPSFDELVGDLAYVVDADNQSNLAKGEIAALLQIHHNRGGLQKAAISVNASYKTLAEYSRIIRYYQGLTLFSAPQKLSMGDSVARDLLAEFPQIQWTHLRHAFRYNRHDPWQALARLRDSVEWGDKGMTPDQLEQHILTLRNTPERQVITITKEGPTGRMTTTINAPRKIEEA